MTTVSRRQFIVDQVDAVAADLQLRTHHMVPRAQRIGPQHEATTHLAARLIEELQGGLPLCEHLQGTPARAAWAPGMVSISCFICTVSFTTINDGDGRCDLCGADVGTGHLHAAVMPIGPVQIQAALCGRCRNRPATDRYDAREARRAVVGLIARRYEVRP